MLKALRSAVFLTVLATPLAIPLATYSMAPGDTIVTAAMETDAVSNRSDAADDAAIWLHPEDPAQSIVIGTDKKGGFVLYDLGGMTLQYLPVGKINNVDLRYDFPLAGAYVDIVAASDRTHNTIAVYKLDPVTRTLENIGGEGIDVDVAAYGFCMYRSSRSGKFYAFMIGKRGNIEQWELRDNGAGEVAFDGEGYLEAGAAGFGQYGDVAAVLVNHDVVGDVEPESGAFSRLFRREERVENAVLDFFGNSRAIVFDLDDHVGIKLVDPDR